MLLYIDRVCYRLPDSVQAEGGLGLHLDRNPLDPYLEGLQHKDTRSGDSALRHPLPPTHTLTIPLNPSTRE